MASPFEISQLEWARAPLLGLPAQERAPEAVLDGGGVFNVIAGWVVITQQDGPERGVILDFGLPGELVELDPLASEGQCTVVALTDAILCPISREHLRILRRSHPLFDEQLFELITAANARRMRRLAAVAWRPAKERIAGLLLELAERAKPGAALREGEAVPLPLAQRHIAEATGQTAIHVNRMLRSLREERVCRFERGSLIVDDLIAMRSLAGYAHPFGGTGPAVRAGGVD